MQPKERFLAAIRRQPVDRVPFFDFLFQRPLFRELIGHAPESYNARDAMALTKALGLDGVWIPYGCFAGWKPEQLGANVYKDEWGTTFENSASSWPIDAPIAYPLESREDLARYVPPDPAAEGRLGEIDTALAINREWGQDAVAVLGGVGGPLTTAWMLVGYENICLSLYDDPDFLRDVCKIAAGFAEVAVQRMAKAGVDGMFVSEDLGASHGGLISKEQFREVFKPSLARIVGCIKSHGLPAIVHSCGCIRDYLDDLVDMGIDAIHPLQRTAGMDLAAVKRKYGRRLCIIGNIDSSRTLPFGSLQDVEAETREAIAIAAPGNGYILASDHSLHDGIPVANIRHMFETGRRYGVYPIRRAKG